MKSALLLVLATLLLSLTKILVKFLGDVPTSQIIFVRALFILAATYPILLKNKIKVINPHSKILILRGIFGTLGMFLLFYVVQTTHLATSVSLFYLTPILTVLIAHFLLGDKMPKMNWLYYGLCFLGIIFIKNFSFDLSATGFILSLLSAVFAALAYNMIRLLKGKVPTMLIVFYLPLITAPLVSYWAITQWQALSLHQWLLVSLLSFAAFFAQICLTFAYKNSEASKISHINYLGLPIGVISGMLFFDEIPHTYSLIGMSLVFLGLILSQIKAKA